MKTYNVAFKLVGAGSFFLLDSKLSNSKSACKTSAFSRNKRTHKASYDE